MDTPDTSFPASPLVEVPAGGPDPLFSCCLVRTRQGHLVLQRNDDEAALAPGRLMLFQQAIEEAEQPREAMIRGLEAELGVDIPNGALARLGTVGDADGAIKALWVLLDPIEDHLPQQSLARLDPEQVAVVDNAVLEDSRIGDEVRWAMGAMMGRGEG